MSETEALMILVALSFVGHVLMLTLMWINHDYYRDIDRIETQINAMASALNGTLGVTMDWDETGEVLSISYPRKEAVDAVRSE